MKGFLKIFFASLLALIIFTVIGVLLLIGVATVAISSSESKPDIGENGILVLDLSKALKEQSQENFVANLTKGTGGKNSTPGLFEVVNAIETAKTDANIKALYIKSESSANGMAVGDELRRAIADFKRAKKPVLAYGTTISQKAYYVASEADKIYTHPNGGLEWNGYAVNLMFYKGLLDKLQIQPEIFYAGKFKSATEPFRATQMTPANKLQTQVWLGDLYHHFLQSVSIDRNIDTATLFALANNGSVQTAHDAVKYHLLDGVRYDDEIRAELAKYTKQGEKDKLNFVSMGDYVQSSNDAPKKGKDKIAVLYADGDIVDGKGQDGEIGGDAFKELIRNLRLDNNVKAIVLRVNSPGGSALASDIIWREISLTKKVKPVIVSMGTYAASGGYYISCNGNYIFSEANTITGSIGVFSMMINPSQLLKNKLGITFDGVKTAQYADMGQMNRPMTQPERNFMQASVDSIYGTFLHRVAEGRHKTVAQIDSIAQGRVWTGKRAIGIGLVDATGTLQDAIQYAAKQIKSSNYNLVEYPAKKNFLSKIFGGNNDKDDGVKQEAIKEILGEDGWDTYKKVKFMGKMMNIRQARLPFEMEMN